MTTDNAIARGWDVSHIPAEARVATQFKKGVSGNPGGRSVSLAKYVKKQVGQSGKKLIDALITIALGPTKDIEKEFGAKPTLRDRREAIEVLLERGFGKARFADDDDLGEAAPQLIFNIPRPARELEGRTVVIGMKLEG